MDEIFYDTSMGGRIPTGLPGGFFIYEAEGDEKILFAETNVVKMYGCETFEEFLEYTGGTFSGMVHPDDLLKIQNQIQAQTMITDKRHDYVRYRIISKQGEVKYIEDFGHLLHWGNGKNFFYVFIVDVDKNEFLNEGLNSFAEAEIVSANHDTDGLTGLFNMSYFYHRVQTVLQSVEGRRQDVFFVHFDIPNFKLYNERNGFKLGDELLCALAKTIHDTFEEDIVARFSNDHFVVCAFEDKDTVIKKVETVCKNMLQTQDVNKKVRVKAGIYQMDDRHAEVGLACDHARLACNNIKSRYDVNYCIYDEMLRDNMRKQQYVIDNIEEALEKEYIKVYYQPVVRVATGMICGYEALVRWIRPDSSMLSPADFIETLEQFHLIHMVDQYVVKRVCKDIVAAKEAGEAVVPVSVNISRLDFELCDIFGIIEDIREEYGVERNLLDIEITESVLNENMGYIKSECQKMKDKGYNIWLDDFGSGYSSLNTLTEYTFDVLKLDMVFLRSYDHNEKTAQLMRYIIDGARGLGLSPLCEGVETEEHYNFLRDAGCERAQGYFFGKPLPIDESRAFTASKGLKWEL